VALSPDSPVSPIPGTCRIARGVAPWADSEASVSLGERIASMTVPPPPRCTVGILRESLTPEQVKEFDELAAADITSALLTRAVQAEYGVRLSQNTMARHRRRDCQCP